MDWWEVVAHLEDRVRDVRGFEVHPSAKVDPEARLLGDVRIGEGTIVGRGATIWGPVWIGTNCLIGNNAFIRGPVWIGNNTRIGFSVEVKRAVVGNDVKIGPLCFVADSVVEGRAFLGALVRTSNVPLNGKTVRAYKNGTLVDTQLPVLGAHIGEGASLGVGVIILPGRSIPPRTILGPGIVVTKALKPGVYVLKQEIHYEPLEGEGAEWDEKTVSSPSLT